MGGVTFRQTFLPLQFVSRVLCTTPFTVKNGHLAYSKPSVALSLLYFTIFITTAVLFFMENPMLMPADLFQIKTVSFVVWFRTIANISVLTILIVGISITSKTFMKQIIKLSALETEFFKLDQDDHISQCNRKNRNASVVLCVVSHLVFSVGGGFLAAFTRKSWQSSSLMEQICCCVIMMYPRLVVGNVNLTIYLIQMLLQTRFAVINNYLRRKIGESKRVKKYPVGTHFCEEVRHLGGLHKSLVQIAKEFNGIFSFHLLVWITISFILLVGDLYVAIYFFSHLSWNNIVFALNLVKNILMYSFDLLMLSRYSSQLCHEANLTKRLLVRIEIDADREDERNTVISETLKLNQNCLKITACNLFDIDNCLIFSICGAASSYLFIMIQMDLGNGKNDANATTISP